MKLLATLLFFFSMIPAARAHEQIPFPDIPFTAFSEFVRECFHPDVSLSVVLVVFFTVIRNPGLLVLHLHRKPVMSDAANRSQANWGSRMARHLLAGWNSNTPVLRSIGRSETRRIEDLTYSIERLLEVLKLTRTLRDSSEIPQISETEIKPLLFLTPPHIGCRTAACKKHPLQVNPQFDQTPIVTVIQGTNLLEGAVLLSGRCSKCESIGYPDRATIANASGTGKLRMYHHSATYLKIGQNLWADRTFCSAVLQATYYFASTTSFTDFFCASFSPERRLKRRNTYAAFVLESQLQVTAAHGRRMFGPEGMSITDMVKSAGALIKNGHLPIGFEHRCTDCEHDYVAPEPANLVAGVDPAATHGVDRLSAQIQHATPAAQQTAEVDVEPVGSVSLTSTTPTIRMAVIDGIVMGPLHCAKEDCAGPLVNSTTGVFCQTHLAEFGHLCHVVGCSSPWNKPSLVCGNPAHQEMWKKHKARFGNQSLLTMRRLVRRSREEQLEWNPAGQTQQQPQQHDADDSETRSERQHYFYPARFYCVEVMVNPCGVPIGWDLFAKSESPTKIIAFIEKMHPPNQMRGYYAIDKACQVLRRVITMDKWETLFKQRSRLIVDTYHYINHRVDDLLCRTWCNPAPLDGSAPNLVKRVQVNDQEELVRAFNTQVSIIGLDNFQQVLTSCRHVSS
jgi:hypothetical protein